MSQLQDDRQSETALLVRRGACRLLRSLGFAVLYELPLATGRRADIVALSERGDVWIVEVKSSIEDLRADRKWPEYRASCDRLWFAMPPHMAADVFPEEAGLILSDGYGGCALREAPEHRLPPAARKAMLLRFARAAALRLHRLDDPEIGDAF